jgi:chromosomal replication initiator protein
MDGSSQAFHIWREALEHTRALSPVSFEQWFASVQFDGYHDGTVELVARDEFVRDWVKTHFQPTLLKRMRELAGVDTPDFVRVEWRVSSSLANPICQMRDVSAPPRSRPPAAPTPQRPPGRFLHGDSLNAKHTFPNFVVGPSNELAYAAACASAGEGGPRYNPLFLCGGTGLGKTHLMHAIAHRVLEKKPGARVVYVSAERFTNEFIEAIQHHKMDEFRVRYRSSCDLLLLDDIQFLAGREQTQEEFFHTFNALRDADRPIIVSSDKYPQELQRMPERLISRFTSGLVADVHVPELETRVAIVRKKADLEGITLGDDVAVLLAQRIKTNVRELEGTLIRLAAKASLTGRTIDYDFASSEIAMISPARAETTSVEDIQRAVCTHFRLSNSELLSKDRHKSVAFARHVAMYLCRQRLGCSFPELGRAFGNRDHTTVMSAVRRVEHLRQKDPQVNAHLQALEQKLAAAD